MELLDPARLELDLAIPLSEFGQLDLDAPISVTIAGAAPAEGRLQFLPVAGDPRAGSVRLVVEIDTPTSGWIPGIAAEAYLPRRSGSATALVVPLSAVDSRGTDGGAIVYRVREDEAEAVSVTLGPLRGDRVIVTGDVAAGDRIVTGIPRPAA